MIGTRPLAVGDRIPNARLLLAGSGGHRDLRGRHREAVVAIALHDAACPRCRELLRTLAAAKSDFDRWDGRVIAVAPDSPEAATLAAAVGLGVQVLVDPERRLLDGVEAADGPVLLIADRYGQVFEILSPTAGHHADVQPRELEEWLRYLATQCPE